MKVLDSPIANQVEATYCLEVGDFHFFKNLVVAEFKQGAYVSFEDYKEAYELCLDIFNNTPFGFISNRVNSYSINLVDAQEHRKKLKLLHTYAIVTYSHNSKRMLVVEDHYFNLKRKRFNAFIDAFNWVNKKVVLATQSVKENH